MTHCRTRSALKQITSWIIRSFQDPSSFENTVAEGKGTRLGNCVVHGFRSSR
jgi:hypothetical protein